MKTQPHKILDIIAVGQLYIDFHGVQIGSSLKDMVSFKKNIGGTCALIAIACARLGLKTAMISRVGDDEMGHFLIDGLNAEKINTSQIKKDAARQSAITLQTKKFNGSHPVIFYGEKCAYSAMEENDIDPNIINLTQAILVSSSSFISETVGNATQKAITYAQKTHAKIILAMDHEKNTVSSLILSSLQAILPHCDMVIGSETTFQSLSGSQSTQLALNHLRSITNSIFVLKATQGCFIFHEQIPDHWQSCTNHSGLKTSPSPCEAKEAFIAGFLRAWLYKASFEKCCEYAHACAILVQLRKEEPNSFPSSDEVIKFISESARSEIDFIKSYHFAHIHYASTRRQEPKELYLFHFGYHEHWQKMAELNQVDESVLAKAKVLIARGVANASQHESKISIISDEITSNETFDLFSNSRWLARSIEVPGEIPFQCKVEPDITFTLSQWPKYHGVKVLLPYHPDDRYVLRGQQESNLSLLFKACRATEHELLIELAPPPNSLITTNTLAHIMHRFYEIGIYPDWWQISLPRDQRCWESMQRVIDENDPYCRGIILSSHHASFEHLSKMFEMIAKQKYCKGYAIAKPLFQHPIEQWLAQKISDQALIEIVSANFTKSIELWKKAQQSLKAQKSTQVTVSEI